MNTTANSETPAVNAERITLSTALKTLERTARLNPDTLSTFEDLKVLAGFPRALQVVVTNLFQKDKFNLDPTTKVLRMGARDGQSQTYTLELSYPSLFRGEVPEDMSTLFNFETPHDVSLFGFSGNKLNFQVVYTYADIESGGDAIQVNLDDTGKETKNTWLWFGRRNATAHDFQIAAEGVKQLSTVLLRWTKAETNEPPILPPTSFPL